jgi:hypothetical protein
MRRALFRTIPTLSVAIASSLVAVTGSPTGAEGTQFGGATQVVTVYFAGTLLKSNTVFHYGGGTPEGTRAIPELLQYLYNDQDVSGPNQHKIWVDGIGDDTKGPLDAGLAARQANRCMIGSVERDPWDPLKQAIRFQSGFGFHLAGFECWDYRLREALDTNRVTDLFRITDKNRNSPVILNIMGHSRGGILAMMLAHKVSGLQRRYSPTGDLVPESTRFSRINIMTFDPVPGNPDEIGLLDLRAHKFVKSHEYFSLSPKVSHYVGFYAKDERQNLFEAVVPHHTPSTKSWLLPLNGAHQTLVGNPRRDGHKYHALASQDYGKVIALGSIGSHHSDEDAAAKDVGIVTSIIARELLNTADWGHVRFKTSWRSDHPGLHYGAANCENNEQGCARYFIERYVSQTSMPVETRAVMRRVTNPRHSAVIQEGGLQGWDFGTNKCSIRIINHAQFEAHGTDHGKCTFRAGVDGSLRHVSLLDRSPDLSGSGITDMAAEEVCTRLVDLTKLPWNCRR